MKLSQNLLKWCGTIAGSITVGSVMIATLLYAQIIPINLFDMWVSNLGIGPNGSSIVFKMGFITAGIFLICFSFGLYQWFWSTNKKAQIFMTITVLMQFTAGVCIIIVAFFDMASNLAIHVTAANLYFFPQLFTALFGTITMVLTKKMTRKQWGIIIMLLVLTAIYLPVYLYSELILFFHGASMLDITFDQWVIMMGSMEPEMAWVRFIEWFAGTGLQIWLIQSGFHMRKFEQTKPIVTEVKDPVSVN